MIDRIVMTGPRPGGTGWTETLAELRAAEVGDLFAPVGGLDAALDRAVFDRQHAFDGHVAILEMIQRTISTAIMHPGVAPAALAGQIHQAAEFCAVALLNISLGLHCSISVYDVDDTQGT